MYIYIYIFFFFLRYITVYFIHFTPGIPPWRLDINHFFELCRQQIMFCRGFRKQSLSAKRFAHRGSYVRNMAPLEQNNQELAPKAPRKNQEM